jgi:hypothetical protein
MPNKKEQSNIENFIIKLIGEHFNDLTDREKEVINKRFGNERMTLEEVGKSMGVSRERIRQILMKAFERIRRGIEKSTEKQVSDFYKRKIKHYSLIRMPYFESYFSPNGFCATELFEEFVREDLGVPIYWEHKKNTE